MAAKPFLKWAGGKTQLLNEIKSRIPFSKEESFTYLEPFIGSGAVFFWMLENFPNIEKAVINDVNTDLIDAYKSIRNNVNELISILEEFEVEYNSLIENPDKRKEVYYSKRALFNSRNSSKTTQSALFIFLNKTCFNGLFRVNRENEFNVPQGNYKSPNICNAENLIAVSEILKKVIILNGDYTETIQHINHYNLFYFDPPYKPLSQTSSFNSYARDFFGDEEQIRLKMFCDQLDHNGSHWLLSNSDVKNTHPEDEFFDDLYQDYQIERVLAKRSINSNSEKRGVLTELLISNKKA